MAPSSKSPPAHRWSFFRKGGVDQVRLDTGADLVHLDELDQKLWVALSCPVKGLEFDERTLALLDSDHDGRVRVPEILTAVRWLREVLKNPDDLLPGKDGVALASIAETTPAGKRVLASARHILQSLGSKANVITVADTQQTADVFAKGRLNGDGVVPPDSIDDEPARAVATEIIACLGGRPDRSGRQGIDQAQLDTFFTHCQSLHDWQQKADADARTVLPLGERTAAAAAAVDGVRKKVDDWFARARLLAFDPRSATALNGDPAAWLAIAARDLETSSAAIADFPLATVEAAKPLSLTGALNPAWVTAVATFREAAVAPLLGKDKTTLTEAEWTQLAERLAAFRTWHSSRPATAIDKLGVARVRAILAAKNRAVLQAAIAADLAIAPEIEAMNEVEKLTRLHRDLVRLLNNFTNFADFYSKKQAVFQAGWLYLDARRCDLCVKVADAGKHSVLATMSRTYLAYVDCTNRSGEKMTIACAFTNGDSDNLFVGRNGLFYDRQGRDWDATIVKIVDHPISIRQAFMSPYKKLLRWIEETVARRAASADANAKMLAVAAATGTPVPAAAAPGAPTPPAAVPPKPKLDVGVVAALGVAVGGITAALAGVFGALKDMKPWQIPLLAAGLILAISLPSMVIAWLKLRQRNLGPILDACGWAVNALTKINLPLGRVLTELRTLPPGAHRTLKDPYAPKRPIWPWILLLLLLLGGTGYGLYHFNYLHKWLPDWIPAHHEEPAPKTHEEPAPKAHEEPAPKAPAPGEPAEKK